MLALKFTVRIRASTEVEVEKEKEKEKKNGRLKARQNTAGGEGELPRLPPLKLVMSVHHFIAY